MTARENRKTVLLVHPGAEMFGSDRMLLESATGLVEAGARVVVALPSTGLLVAPLREAGAEVVILPMLVLRKVLLTPRGLPRLFRDTFRGLGSAWRLIGRLRPDAVYVSTIIIPQWPLIARLRGTRAVSHVHEAEASGNTLVNRLLYAPHLASARTLVNSRFSLDTIRRALPALADRTRVVANGVASPEHPAPPRSRLDGPLRVLYVGRLSPRKGPDLVIDAAAALQAAGRPVEVTLLGAVFEGYEWFERDLRARADETGVPVTFAGFHPDIWPFLAEADVLVVPSRVDEPFGNTAVEGVLGLRPVIASDSSGLREAAGGYATAQLVAPDDADAIATALEEVRERWDDHVAGVTASRDEALRRHAPAVYRAGVTAGVLD
ncbi:glycosyltransferase [Microbacterium paraoxydans]|jgi:glycosyltransferase involved in cell wall biosynthesis|uniref:Glycosyltransferase involved in cell wall bisynthesis n=1 Tax=Microbacterium paraoxydans TaxID=199592 RepID=A0A1H1UMM0_9MICO|nr:MULTISPECIES: glycosyltransferase [Microbacterium]AVL96086.1 glycosyl transferase [Microbacterium sp. str. 'China']SDS73768.1 Glycosyltransferase involved in cell wall bisynthesis [Microbacterium paraoxydans]